MNEKYPFQLMPLPYKDTSLMPFSNSETMYLHHDKLYGSAVHQLNRLVEQYRLWELSLEELIQLDLNLPFVDNSKIKYTAGCVYNHQLYFEGITSAVSQPPPGNSLVQQILEDYGSIQDFRRLLSEAAASLPGVGWVWLVTEGSRELHIATTPNYETIKLDAFSPIFTIDLWEHAYFLVHHFDQAAYINGWFSRLNWDWAEQRFRKASSQPHLHREIPRRAY